MAKSAVSATKTAKANSAKQTNQLSVFRNHVYTMVAAFVGVVFGVLGSLGFVGSYMHSQFANETASLSHQIVSMMPSDMTTSACTVPAGSTGSGSGGVKPAVVTAAHITPTNNASAPSGNGNNGGAPAGNSSHNSFVSQMVSGTISDNGRNSTNNLTQKVSNTETTTNTNTITTMNFNDQSAHSGKASVSNTVNGGSSTTGPATNTNSTTTSYDVEN